MQEPSPFALSRDGSVFVCGDGPELLVYNGDGSPRFKQFCDGILIDLGIVGQAVFCADHEGRICQYRLMDGARLDDQWVEGQPSTLAVSIEGAVAVGTDRGVSVLGGANLPGQSVTALSFGPDRGSLGVGEASGRFRAMASADGTVWGEQRFAGPVAGVAWSAQGHWLVASGSQLTVLSSDGATVVRNIALPGTAGRVACAGTGAFAAVLVDGTSVVMVELAGFAACGALVFRRNLFDVAFTSNQHLGIGLDDGDANVLDLFGSTALRNEPHPGRGRNNWRYDNQVDLGRLRGAIATVKTGGAAIAERVIHEYEQPQQAAAAQPQKQGGNGCMIGCVVVMAISLLCSGCIGFTALLSMFDII